MTGFDHVDIKIKTETPVWTGDADANTSSIKATSLLGGLRFWAEALVRSLGERVCDITSNHGKDVYDKTTPGQEICRVCNTFGCTGFGKSFGMNIINDNQLEGTSGNRIALKEYSYQIETRKNGKTTTKAKIPEWYLNNKTGKSGSFTIQVIPLRLGGINSDLALSLCLMLKWGTLGALDQFGYGMVTADIPDEFLALAQKALPRETPSPASGVSLHDFFFFKFEPERNDRKVPFEIRYLVRQALRDSEETIKAVQASDSNLNLKHLRHYFCGNMKGKTQATKYNIGKKRDGTIAGWGYYPRDERFGKQREICLDVLKEKLREQAGGHHLKWVEFNSYRDTEEKMDNLPLYLEMLLKGGL